MFKGYLSDIGQDIYIESNAEGAKGELIQKRSTL